MSATPAPGADRPRILFTTSNGTGLGHLTRSMAIARRLGDEVEPLFLTLSAAAPVVEAMGFAVEYAPSYATPASGNDYRWSRRLRARLRAVIAEVEPAAVVFDGTHPYEALLGALPADATAVWCRRPLWKRGLEPGAARPRRRLRRGARAGRAGRVRGRRPDRARCAIAPTGSGRSSSSTAPSCSIASGPRPSSGSSRRGPTILVTLGQGAEVRRGDRALRSRA